MSQDEGKFLPEIKLTLPTATPAPKDFPQEVNTNFESHM
jgi:hypothetical protein